MPATPPTRRPMGAVARTLWGLIAVIALGGFLALGQWQIQRRAWKLDLIEQVEARIHAQPTPAPAHADWQRVQAQPQDYAYRRIVVHGTWLYAQTTLVQASTVLGAGWWVMTPLRTHAGEHVLINRGFVPQAQAEGAWRARTDHPVTVTGLLRPSEPDGAFLRKNDPASGRWVARNVAAIAASLPLENVAPYFVDAESRTPLPAHLTLAPPARLPEAMLPVAGLTVVHFSNHHLIYALTWFVLAAMVAGAMVAVGRTEIRLRRMHKTPFSRPDNANL